MAKGHKHSKQQKSEKAKIKLKSKTNQLSKNLNVTNTSFKAKKIVVQEQLKYHDTTEILSTRKLNIKDLLIRLHHHNLTVRREALKELKEILLKYSTNTLYSELQLLVNGIAALSLDIERNIRRDSFSALHLILQSISKEQLISYLNILISYLNCAMTHINQSIKEDSLLFLDVLLQYYGNMLIKNSFEILSNFVNMICMWNSDNKHNRQLMTTLNPKSTSTKWRIKVLERLANMLNYILSDEELNKTMHSSTTMQEVRNYTRFLPIYNGLAKICENDFCKQTNPVRERYLSTEEFISYINTLMPLMFNIWLEVCPDEKLDNYTETMISSEMSTLLKSITNIIQSIIMYIDALDHYEHDDEERTKHWFIHEFYESYMKNFLSRFPYSKTREFNNKSKKCQEDYSAMISGESYVEQNLGLCCIHIWSTSIYRHNQKFPEYVKNYCLSVIKYLNDTIKNWCINNHSVLSQLTKLLRILFLSASSAWHVNGIDLNHTLQLIIEASFHQRKNELQSNLSLIIGNIILEHNLNTLHRQEMFKKYVATLPNLLLRSSIDEATIRMISKITMHFKEWIQKELTIKREAIEENVKKINIIDSHDDKTSRLMICNLFYFVDGGLYY